MISHIIFVGLFKKHIGLLKNINVIPPLTLRVSYIILTITLTVILISSPVIAVYSPSMVLKVGFTSAYATTSENSDNNNEGEEL